MLRSLEELKDKALNDGKTQTAAIAVAEDLYVLQAVERIYELGLIAPIFIGNGEKILSLISDHKLKLPSDSIIHTTDHKDAAAQAVRLAKSGDANLIMKGLLSTQDFIRAIVDKHDGIVNGNVLSHLAIFESPYYHKLFGITDAAMNIQPDIHLRLNIIMNAVNAFQLLGIPKPRVAVLAAVEKVNPKMIATSDAEKIAQLVSDSEEFHCSIQGPLALDLAISVNAARHKGLSGEVAGNADILLVPEITSGNILYKSLTCLGGAKTAGILLGANVPVVLTSRADSTESKFYSLALACQLCK